MEKYIWLVKAVHEINGEKRVDNLFAVSSEEQAKQDVKTLRERFQKDKIEFLLSFETWYIYEKIELFH